MASMTMTAVLVVMIMTTRMTRIAMLLMAPMMTMRMLLLKPPFDTYPGFEPEVLTLFAQQQSQHQTNNHTSLREVVAYAANH